MRLTKAARNRWDNLRAFVTRWFAPSESPVAQKTANALERPTHLEAVLARTRLEFVQQVQRSYHCPEHWERVERNAIALCEANPQADLEVCRLFAICHDCQRRNEGADPLHGHRAAAWIQQNLDLIPVTGDRLEKLLEACRGHSDGKVSDDPTIGTCWDADRLDLTRMGITPNPNLLSTNTAKQFLLTANGQTK